ncbi:putative glycoside hydrolase, partial [Burkholderia sp. SRS-25]
FDRRAFDAADIRAQVDAADAAGTDGWMLWNPRNRYDPAALPR